MSRADPHPYNLSRQTLESLAQAWHSRNRFVQVPDTGRERRREAFRLSLSSFRFCSILRNPLFIGSRSRLLVYAGARSPGAGNHRERAHVIYKMLRAAALKSPQRSRESERERERPPYGIYKHIRRE